MSSNCQEGATTLDFMHAMAFSLQQMNKMKCEDPDIIKNVCESKASGVYAGGGTCIQWEQDEKEMIFPRPQNYYINECRTDDDCYMGKCKDGICQCSSNDDCSGGLECKSDPKDPDHMVCAYDPQDVAAGHCIFNNATACKAQGQLPYVCNCGPDGNAPGQCVSRNKKELNKPYTEWHVDPKTGQGKCVLGNFPLRQWCEQPCTRCKLDPKTNQYPANCTAGADSRGVTDVPPFYYDENKGACYMTHDYCSWYGIDYNGKSCTSDTDCYKNEYCANDGYCSGPDSECVIPTGQKIGEFFVGKTLFYMMKKHTDCTEKFTTDRREEDDLSQTDFLKEIEQEATKNFNSLPEIACYMHNPNKITRRKELKKDFGGPGINLYIYEKNGKIQTGFDPDEVEHVYPNNVERHPDDITFICVERDEIQNDKFLQRIYLTINSSDWMTKTLVWATTLKK